MVKVTLLPSTTVSAGPLMDTVGSGCRHGENSEVLPSGSMAMAVT